jgi:hypothetical protein
MKAQKTSLPCFLILCFSASCTPSSDVHREEGKVFHASIPDSGVGGLYFGLYDDQEYQICSSGGIDQTCYTGKYMLNNDTLTLLNLSPEIPLQSNKLLIKRFAAPQNSDLDLGEVLQLDKQNIPLKNATEFYFAIRMDSLETIRNIVEK